MGRQFPYLAAITVTSFVGTVTTLVWAAQVPAPHMVAPVIARVSSPPMAASPITANAGNAANTPASTGAAFPTGNVALQVGANGAPALTQAATFSQAGLNQPGQPPFSELSISQQTSLNQPGQPDFYQGYNPSIVQANEGVRSPPRPTPIPRLRRRVFHRLPRRRSASRRPRAITSSASTAVSAPGSRTSGSSTASRHRIRSRAS